MNKELKLKPVLRVETPELAYSFNVDTPSNELQKMSSEVQLIDTRTLDFLKGQNVVKIPGNVEDGDILILHPFIKGQYVKVVDAESIAYKDYLNYMGNIAWLMGATRMRYKFEITNIQKRTMDVNGNISYMPYVDISGSDKHDTEKKGTESHEKEREFDPPGSLEEQMKDYQEACNLIKRYGWDTDTDFTTLIETRNPNRTRKENHREVSLKTTNEINDRIEAAFSLKAMGDVFSISANYMKSMEIKKEIELHIDILFK